MKAINESESQYLYLLKGIACFFVVFIHFGTAYKGGFYELTRVAVPVFFIIQGRFLAIQINGKTVEESRKKNKQTLLKLSKKTFFVSLMYTILSFVLCVIVNNMNILDWVDMKFAPIEWIKLLVLNSSNVIYDFILLYDHQWYLYATLVAILIIILLQRYLNKYVLMVLTIPLIIRLIDQYTFQVANDGIWLYGECIRKMFLVRNFLFTGLPFLAYGMFLQYINKDKYSIRKCNIIKWILLIGCLCGMFLTFLEFRHFGSQELYVGSTIFALCVTTISRFLNHNYKSLLSWVGKNLSKDIYFWHPFIAAVLGYVLSIRIDAKLYPFFICMCSLCVAVVVWRVRVFYEEKKQFVN